MNLPINAKAMKRFEKSSCLPERENDMKKEVKSIRRVIPFDACCNCGCTDSLALDNKASLVLRLKKGGGGFGRSYIPGPRLFLTGSVPSSLCFFYCKLLHIFAKMYFSRFPPPADFPTRQLPGSRPLSFPPPPTLPLESPQTFLVDRHATPSRFKPFSYICL